MTWIFPVKSNGARGVLEACAQYGFVLVAPIDNYLNSKSASIYNRGLEIYVGDTQWITQHYPLYQLYASNQSNLLIERIGTEFMRATQ